MFSLVTTTRFAEPKSAIVQQASKTDFPRTIVLRGPLGDSKAFYPSFTTESLFGNIVTPLHHHPDPNRYDVEADSDGVFSLLYLDSNRVLDLP